MKSPSFRLAAIVLLPAASLMLAACSPGIPGEEQTVIGKYPTGTTVVETFKSTATVTSIDKKNRKLWLKFSNGERKTVTCGPEVVNFPQIQSGDLVNVTVTEEMAIFLDKGQAAKAPETSGTVHLAPVGAKPAIVTSNVLTETVKISTIDSRTRKMTFRINTGELQTVTVNDHIDLTKFKVGDSVTIRWTEAMALLVDPA